MEQTLGRRIAQQRKRLGLTQDALAEKLGITPQAVSKWENDLSCPDITTLPQLADIFGISTDELLGHCAPEHETPAESQNTAADSDSDFQSETLPKNDWEFHWEGSRQQGLLAAIGVLWIGGLLLFCRLQEWDISFWDICWPSAIVLYGISGLLRRFSAFRFGCILFGSYFLVSNLGLWTLDIAGQLIFPICIVLLGASLFFDAFHKPKKSGFRMGKNKQTHPSHTYANDENSFSSTVNFCHMKQQVDVSCLVCGTASVNFGDLIIDLSEVESIADDCSIEANCAFGKLTFLVPRKYYVNCDRNISFGKVHIQGTPAPSPEATINLNGNVSFGQCRIHYI